MHYYHSLGFALPRIEFVFMPQDRFLDSFYAQKMESRKDALAEVVDVDDISFLFFLHPASHIHGPFAAGNQSTA